MYPVPLALEQRRSFLDHLGISHVLGDIRRKDRGVGVYLGSYLVIRSLVDRIGAWYHDCSLMRLACKMQNIDYSRC